MGHNRAGDKARARLRRRIRHDRRLAAKAAAPGQPNKGLLKQVKDIALGAAEKIGAAAKTAGKTIKKTLVGEKKKTE